MVLDYTGPLLLLSSLWVVRLRILVKAVFTRLSWGGEAKNLVPLSTDGTKDSSSRLELSARLLKLSRVDGAG